MNTRHKKISNRIVHLFSIIVGPKYHFSLQKVNSWTKIHDESNSSLSLGRKHCLTCMRQKIIIVDKTWWFDHMYLLQYVYDYQ